MKTKYIFLVVLFVFTKSLNSQVNDINFNKLIIY